MHTFPYDPCVAVQCAVRIPVVSDTQQWFVWRADVEPEKLSGSRKANQTIIPMRFDASECDPMVNAMKIQRAVLLLHWMIRTRTLSCERSMLTLKSRQCALRLEATRQLSLQSHAASFQTSSSADVLSLFLTVCRSSLEDQDLSRMKVLLPGKKDLKTHTVSELFAAEHL